MLTENHIKEGLSRAYILAVAHRAGVNCSLREFDYGIDGTFHEIKVRGGRRVESGVKIDFQAKASERCQVQSTEVVYDLEAKSHRDLTDSEGTARILIVLALPENSACEAHRGEAPVTLKGRLERVGHKQWILFGVREFGLDFGSEMARAQRYEREQKP
jgi:Domain of unknown function (DUF4365)